MEDYFIQREEVDKQELKRSVDRLKRIQALLCLSLIRLDDLFRFKYPFFSSLVFFLLHLYLYFLDFDYILGNLMGALVLILLWNHPLVNRGGKGWLEKLFFQENMLNPYYYAPLVQTVDQYEAQFNQSFHTIDLKVGEKTNIY